MIRMTFTQRTITCSGDSLEMMIGVAEVVSESEESSFDVAIQVVFDLDDA